MPNQKNIQKVEDIVQSLKSAKSAALVQYQGLNAAATASLRQAVKNNGGLLEVTKNSLITRALTRLGVTLPAPLIGPTAIAYSNQDEITPLKEIDTVNKQSEKTSFKYGLFNLKLLSQSELSTLLSLPSKTTLISQLIGGLQNPLSRLVYSLRFPQTRLVLVLKALAEKQKTAQT